MQGALSFPAVLIGLSLIASYLVEGSGGDGIGPWASIGITAIGLGAALAAISFNLAAKVKTGRASVRMGILVLEWIVVGLQVLDPLCVWAFAALLNPPFTQPSDWVIWLLVFWVPTGTGPPVIAALLAAWILRGVSRAEARAWFHG